MLDWSKIHYRFGKKPVDTITVHRGDYIIKVPCNDISINEVVSINTTGSVSEAKPGDMAIGYTTSPVKNGYVTIRMFDHSMEMK